MEYMFDTANIKIIEEYSKVFPITGITSNPSIIKKEGKIDFFNHFRQIREIIGNDKTLHIQVTSKECDKMLREAEAIRNKVDDKVCIKVPVNMEGLKAIRILKSEGANVTATAIYTKAQGLLAMEAGADFIAPYFNRMENLNIDPRDTIRTFSAMIEKYNYKTKILAASFKNIGQVNDAFMCGAQTATIAPDILIQALEMPSIQKAVDDFSADWEKIFGQKTIEQL